LGAEQAWGQNPSGIGSDPDLVSSEAITTNPEHAADPGPLIHCDAQPKAAKDILEVVWWSER